GQYPFGVARGVTGCLTGAFDHDGSPAVQELCAAGIDVGAVNALRAPDHDVVREIVHGAAIGAGATQAVRKEQIIIATAVDYEGPLTVSVGALGEVLDVTADPIAARVELDQHDPVPEAAEIHPRRALLIDDHVRIDGIVVF